MRGEEIVAKEGEDKGKADTAAKPSAWLCYKTKSVDVTHRRTRGHKEYTPIRMDPEVKRRLVQRHGSITTAFEIMAARELDGIPTNVRLPRNPHDRTGYVALWQATAGNGQSRKMERTSAMRVIRDANGFSTERAAWASMERLVEQGYLKLLGLKDVAVLEIWEG